MSKHPAGHVAFPVSATAASFFDKSVGILKTQLAILLKDQLIGKALTRPSDNGMFSYDVVVAYPDLAEAYMALCPERTDLVTMQKTVMKYVEDVPTSAVTALLELKETATAVATSSETAARVLLASQNGPAAASDIVFRELVVTLGTTLLSAGKLDPERGDVVATNTSKGKVQTRPKPGNVGGKASDAVAPDPISNPPTLIASWFQGLVSRPTDLVYNDVALLCNNCCLFNANNTIDTSFVTAAKSLKEHGYLCTQSVSTQLQALFARWWKTNGIWKGICAEAAKVGPIRRTPPPQPTTVSTDKTSGNDMPSNPQATSAGSRRSINFNRRTVPEGPSQLSEPASQPPAVTETAPEVAAAPPSASSIPPAMTTKPQPLLREAFPTIQPIVTNTPLAPSTVSGKASAKIHLTKIAAVEEARRAEKKRLLDLLTRYQQGDSNQATHSTRLAAVTAGKDSCPPSLYYAIPEQIRVDTVLEHLQAKDNALMAAERYREEALMSVFSNHQVNEQMQAAAVLFSVFEQPSAENAIKTEEGNNQSVSFSTPKVMSSAGIFANGNSAGGNESALSTLSAFYDAAVARSSNDLEKSSVKVKSDVDEANLVSQSVSQQIYAAYNDMQLAELRELLTMLVAALHKATAVTSVLLYGHELAEWYSREHHAIIAASTVTGNARQGDEQGLTNVGLKREREPEETITRTHGNTLSSLPSFWSEGNFTTKESSAALHTATVVSTKILVRLLLWFPHLVATCARTASSNAQRNSQLPDAAESVSLVISSSIACPLVDQLLAFIDERRQGQ